MYMLAYMVFSRILHVTVYVVILWCWNKKKTLSFIMYGYLNLLVVQHYVIYLHFIQGVKILVSTAVTVTLPVPRTVETARVIYKVERASRVNQDGVERTVIQVRCHTCILSIANSHSRIRYNFYFNLTF